MILWSGLTCCFSAAVFYLIGRSCERELELLKKVIRVNQLKELAQLFDLENKVLPLIVTISGRVGSETPINCKNSELKAVIVEETASQHFLKKDDKGSWIKDSVLMLFTRKVVPWYLDDGTGCAYVGANGTAGLAQTVGSELFEQSGQSTECETSDHQQCLKMLGVKRVEKVLPTGSSLTVVGEAVKDRIGKIWIRKPHKGPFYVSHNSIDQLISNLGDLEWCGKYASFGLTIFGVILITKHAIQYVLERRRRWEFQRRVPPAAAKKSGADNEGNSLAAAKKSGADNEGNSLDPTWKTENVQKPDLCVICLEQECNAVFIQCGHMCCCMTCSSHLTTCPLCRGRIEQVVKVFRH